MKDNSIQEVNAQLDRTPIGFCASNTKTDLFSRLDGSVVIGASGESMKRWLTDREGLGVNEILPITYGDLFERIQDEGTSYLIEEQAALGLLDMFAQDQRPGPKVVEHTTDGWTRISFSFDN